MQNIPFQKFFSAINYKTLEDVRNSNSLNIFKIKLKLHFRFSPPLYHIYTEYRKASIYHTRLRLGMSSLAAHFFLYGSSDTPYCSCGARENTHHFLLECPHYAVQWTELLVAIRDLIAPNTHHSLLPTLDANRLTIILLKGSDDLVTIETAFIFRCVQKFIKSSNRFS